MIDFLDAWSQWILYFFSYSILGWVFESCYCSLKTKPMRWVNRGFLFGPLCPIYGLGLVAVIFIMQPFNHIGLAGEFFMAVLVCSVIEYFASLIMEKIYHVRWWSYERSKFNPTLHGRISLMTSLGFGLGGLLVINLIHPSIKNLVLNLSFDTKIALAVSLTVIFLIDNYMSNAAAASIKHALKGGEVDLTEEIKRYAFNYYRKQTRRTRKIARIILKKMKLAQKRALKQLRGTQRKLMKRAEKIQYLAKKIEIRKEIAQDILAYMSEKTGMSSKSQLKDRQKSKSGKNQKAK